MSRIAFLGLGTMGKGMVRNLAAAGHDVVVWNRSPLAEGFAGTLGVAERSTVAEAVGDAEFVLYCVSDDRAIVELVLSEGGLAEIAPRDAVVIDLSTIDPDTSAAQAKLYADRGVSFLDAPVFGSQGEAQSGGLWTVVGGDRAVFEAARPVLEAISETIHYMGESGNGARMKLVGNLIVAAQLEALGESLTLARAAGLDLRDVLGVLKVTDFRSPIFDGVGAAVIEGDYSPNFALDLMLKDALLVAGFAERMGAPVPGTAATLSTIRAAIESGWGRENASALIKVLARDARVDLQAATD